MVCAVATKALALSLRTSLDEEEEEEGSVQTQESVPSEEGGNVAWRKGFQPYHAKSVPKLEDLGARAVERASEGLPPTTMMLRNVPNKYTQATLLQEIDDSGFASSYDFFYLPMDLHNRCNVGYAFINFLRYEEAARFRVALAQHRFRKHRSRKIGGVCAAHVQGLDANLHHFENRAVTLARNDQYRPIVLRGQTRVPFEDAVEEAKVRAGRAPAAPPQLEVSTLTATVLPAGALLQSLAATKPAAQPAWDAPAFIDDMSGDCGLGRARLNLEVAIRDLLGSAQKLTLPSLDAADGLAAPPGLENVASPSRPRVASFNTALAEAGDDISQLLALRSMLFDRLAHKRSQQ